MEAVTDEQDPPIMMLRAEITREQFKALRKLAVENDVTLQRLIGHALAFYLASFEAS